MLFGFCVYNIGKIEVFLSFFFFFNKYRYICTENKQDVIMNATIDISYNQIMALIQQLPVRSQLQLGKALTSKNIRAELNHFMETFHTDDITEDDILSEVKAVRHARYAQKR